MARKLWQHVNSIAIAGLNKFFPILKVVFDAPLHPVSVKCFET